MHTDFQHCYVLKYIFLLRYEVGFFGSNLKTKGLKIRKITVDSCRGFLLRHYILFSNFICDVFLSLRFLFSAVFLCMFFLIVCIWGNIFTINLHVLFTSLYFPLMNSQSLSLYDDTLLSHSVCQEICFIALLIFFC